MNAPALAPYGDELLDDPAADPRAVVESLKNIARSNRWFGGCAAVRFGLATLLGKAPPGERLTLLDIGTGLGDIPQDLVRWGAGRGLRIVPIALERHPAAAHLAREGGLPTVLGCAGALPVAEKSVDLVLLSQVVHHLAAGEVVRLLGECDRIARRGVVVSDLRRSWFAVTGFRIGAAVLRFDAATRADGVTSIRRGFTSEELGGLLRQAGVRTRVYRRPGYRLVAAWRPGDVT